VGGEGWRQVPLQGRGSTFPNGVGTYLDQMQDLIPGMANGTVDSAGHWLWGEWHACKVCDSGLAAASGGSAVAGTTSGGWASPPLTVLLKAFHVQCMFGPH